MGYRFFTLVGETGTSYDDIEKALDEMGLQCAFATSKHKLFTSAQTPVFPIPGGGIIIGHLFSRDGRPISTDSFPRISPTSRGIRRLLLEYYWGEYLLLQPTADGEHFLTLMRDPSGGVPCVYSFRNGNGFITSDISIATNLNLHANQIDWTYIAQCLAYPHLNTERTGLSNIRELLPGCSLQLHGTTISTQLEWSPWAFVAHDRRHSDPREAEESLRSSIRTVVRSWAETDESLMLEISGGLDSSIVAACLHDIRASVTCSTLLTPVPGADERQYARLVAQMLGADLHVELLKLEHAHFDFALPAQSVTPAIGPLQHAVDEVMGAAGEAQGAASHFCGSGGDSVFCYLTGASPAADAFRACGVRAGCVAIRDLSDLHRCTYWKAGRLTLRKLLRSHQPPSTWDSSFLPLCSAPRVEEIHPWFMAPSGALPGDRERIFDLAGTQIFRAQSPRGTKRWLRMPLLSQPVVESCLRIPTWMWISGGRNRAVARSAFADILPLEVLNRRSKGTFMNYLGEVFQRNKPQIQEFLLSGRLGERGLLDLTAIRSFMESDLPLHGYVFTRIFDLCRVENWVRHHP